MMKIPNTTEPYRLKKWKLPSSTNGVNGAIDSCRAKEKVRECPCTNM